MYIPNAIAALVAVVSASTTRRDAQSLDFKLTSVRDTIVLATVTNIGSRGFELLNEGTFLDPSHVEKFIVESTSGPIPFLGIRKRINIAGLDHNAFTTLRAGEAIHVEVDLATVHDLSAGGDHRIMTSGAISYAESGTKSLVPGRALTYASDILHINVNGTIASRVPRVFSHLKRTAIEAGSCNAQQRKNVDMALQQCSQLASSAADAALFGPITKFEEYFKTREPASRERVHDRFQAVAAECSTTNRTRLTCQDNYMGCNSATLAYTYAAENIVFICPQYFSLANGTSSTCHSQDRATTTIHEFTHAPGVFSPATQDNGYGYGSAMSLTSEQAVLNADSYALFANAIYSGC